MSERAKFNYFHKINAEIIKKINPEYLDLRLWKNPKLYMSPISLLITAFDTTLIDKPGIKIPVSLEYCNASSAEMNHLADILQFHITSPSNLTKLNLSGCQFQQLDYLYIIEQLGKYPSLTTLNLSKAKIDHTEIPLKHRIPSEKISQALHDLKAKIPNIEITVSNGKFLQPRPSLPEQKS
ncbi:hypothetical protein [Paraburkholderia bonniea]|uniref:hypothetical protein n=1 Tax=Paraburkholderia bonniea TaxID=2152891 RepID=UPI001291740F|nr:hypothetical protein [Paraburkholderia bonniea]